MVFRFFRDDRERPVDRVECVRDPAAQHLRCGQQPKRDLIPRVHLDHAGDDVGRLVKAPGAQQQLAGMQRVLPIAGCQGQGTQRKSHGVLGLLEGEFQARHLPQDSADGGRNGRRAHQIVYGILV